MSKYFDTLNPYNPGEPTEKAGKRRESDTDGKAILEKRGDGKWMVIPPDTDVYLEAVETSKDTQTDRIRDARVCSLRRRVQPESLLEDGGNRSRTKSINKRKTDKLGLL